MMSKSKKIIAIVVGLIVLAIILFFALPHILGVFTKDIPPINDSDLIVSLDAMPPIPNDENAYYDINGINLEVIAEYDAKLVKSHLKGETWDKKYVEEVIAKNSQVFKLIDAASKKSRFQTPVREYIWNPALLRQGVELTAVKAIYLSKQGNEKEAFKEIFKLLYVGQKIHDYQYLGFIDFLIGEMTKKIGLDTLKRLLIESDNLLSEDLRAYALKLDNVTPDKTGLNNYYKYLYTMTAATIDALASGDIDKLRELGYSEEDLGSYGSSWTKARKGESFYFRPNESKALESGITRLVLNDINKPCSSSGSGPSWYDEYERSVEEVKKLRSGMTFYFTENALGKLGHHLFVSGFVATGIPSICSEEMVVGITKTALLLKAYKIDNGTLPTDLNKLVPYYVSKLPIDPYSNSAFKYSLEKKIIYSVGSDKTDSGGSEGDNLRTMDDPTFKLEF